MPFMRPFHEAGNGSGCAATRTLFALAVGLAGLPAQRLEAQMVEQSMLQPRTEPSKGPEVEFAESVGNFLGGVRLPFAPFALPRTPADLPDPRLPAMDPDYAVRIVLVHALSLEGESKRFEKELADPKTGETFRKALETEFEHGIHALVEMIRDCCREFFGRRGASEIHARVLCASALVRARLGDVAADRWGYSGRTLTLEFGEATREALLASVRPEVPAGREAAIPVSALWVYAHGGAAARPEGPAPGGPGPEGLEPQGLDTWFSLEGGEVRPSDFESEGRAPEIECVVLHCCGLGQDRADWARAFRGRLRTWSGSVSWAEVLADQERWRFRDPGGNLGSEPR